jgi:hypothetical protein
MRLVVFLAVVVGLPLVAQSTSPVCGGAAPVVGDGYTYTAALCFNLSQHSMLLSWPASTILNPISGQVVAGYNVYRAARLKGTYKQINTALVAGPQYIDSAAPGSYCWEITGVDNLGHVSPYSNPACGTIATAP